jgi:hypothetical protein
MAGWQPIATAPRETGRPLLLYPRPRPSGSTDDGPLLDLTNTVVRRMITLAKRRGYVTYDELNQILPSEEFSSKQVEDVVGQLSGLGIDVVGSDDADRAEDNQFTATGIYISVFEGFWYGDSWRTSTGRTCEPTHWMPMPSPPLTIVHPGQ